MRAVAAIPATGLLAGAAVGLLAPDCPHLPAHAFLIAGGVLSWWGWRVASTRLLAAAVAAVFFLGGVLLSGDAWERAWRPPLWSAFEELAHAQRAEAEAKGRRLPLDEEAFAVVRGTLRADGAPNENGVSLSLQVEGLARQDGRDGQERTRLEREGFTRAPGGIIVTVVGALAAERIDDWRAGRRVRMPVLLHRPSRYLDPGVPDQERALARRGTRLVGSVKSGALIDVLARATPVDEAMSAARAFARHAIAAAVGRWSAQSAAIVAAIVIGDRAGLDQEVQRRLQEAGTYHVIAISGGNIAILAGLLLGAFRLAGWLGRAAMLSAVALLLAYARLVGDGASVDRATLMAVVYFGARAFDQRSPPLNALATVAAALVATDPLSVADPAFLLTFGATLAILLMAPVMATINAGPAEPADTRLRSASSAVALVAGRTVRSMFAASAAAEALLFPVGAAIFSRVTFAGLGLNFLAIPLMGVAQIAGMAVVPLSSVSEPGAAVAGWVAHAGAMGLVTSASLVQRAPILTYRLAPPSWTAMSIYYAAGALAWTLRRRRSVTGSAESRPTRAVRLVASIVALAAAVWILVDPRTMVAARGDGRLHVTFLDVGQGDSTFVSFPRGTTMLVDTGGLASSSSFDIGERVVAAVLRDAGIRRLDVLVLTHGDPDHIGGAPSILREFRPREVWEGIPVPRFEPLTSLRLATQWAGARWANVYAGDAVAIDGVQVVARHPTPADWERQKVRNDDSIVLELRWRDVSVLLTGDIGKEAERAVATALPRSPLRLVKVAHHGSLTSSTWEFLEAARPQVAIVSAGRSNHFGHPVPEVLERYRAIGAEVFRTDRDGAVTVDTDGSSINLHAFTGRCLSLP